MNRIASIIASSNRVPGIWLAPFMAAPGSNLVREHRDWLLRDENGQPVPVGLTWEGSPFALDTSHPAVLVWLDQLIRKVCNWGFGYLKLDFLYAGALVGKRYQDVPREIAYRYALQVMRDAAGDAYILACGAPIIPSLGLCDGMRIGPDAAPYWINKPLSTWLNNPNGPGAQNALRTSLHRLWLKPLVHTDPDIIFFRSKYNALKKHEKQLLCDLGVISSFKATSDLPQWLTYEERESLREYLESTPDVKKTNRYQYQIDDRSVDFRPTIPLPASVNFPVWLAKYLGILVLGRYQVFPALLERLKHK